MKVHKEGTGLLLTLFTIFFVVDVALYHTVGRGWVFYTTTFVTTVLFLLVLNFFRSPFRRFPFDSEGLVIAPADGTIVPGEWDCQACITSERAFPCRLLAEEQHGERAFGCCHYNP